MSKESLEEYLVESFLGEGDVYQFSTNDELKIILTELDREDCYYPEINTGLVIIRDNDDGCGESWIDVQLICSSSLNFGC